MRCAGPVALVVFVLLFIRSRIQGKGFMASVKASLLSLPLFVGVIAVLIYSTRLAFPEVDMTRTAFTQTSVDASTGAHVHFVNPSNGLGQILCVGTTLRRCWPGSRRTPGVWTACRTRPDSYCSLSGLGGFPNHQQNHAQHEYNHSCAG